MTLLTYLFVELRLDLRHGVLTGRGSLCLSTIWG